LPVALDVCLEVISVTIQEENGGPMLCAELEELEAEFVDILTALENPDLTEQERRSLQVAYSRLSRTINDHQKHGHEGGPCFEE
jgi:hypothetical protein